MPKMKSSECVVSIEPLPSNKEDAGPKAEFGKIIFLLKLTMLYFEPKKSGLQNGIVYYFRVLRACGLICIALYYNIFTLVSAIKFWGSEEWIMDVLNFSYGFQILIAMVFLFYWQNTGQINLILESLSFCFNPKSSNKIIFFTLSFMLFSYFLSALSLIGGYAAYFFTVYPAKNKIMDYDHMNVFLKPELAIFAILHVAFGFFVWTVVFSFYIIVTLFLLAKLNQNNKELESVGKGEGAKAEDIHSELSEQFRKHVNHGKAVFHVDKTFEVYTFLMVGSNIPITIFVLITFVKALSQDKMLVIMLGTALAFTLIELIGLVAVPAQLHETIHQVESILYFNEAIWFPQNDKIYQLTSAFLTHVRQGNFGISLWGFAVVSKPLVLTTISLTLTYLVLLVQLNPSTNPGNEIP